MKRLLPIAAIALLASGCNWSRSDHEETRDAGPAATRNYQVGAFDRISVSGPYEVSVETGGQPGVTANGGEAILADTEVVVENGELKIRPKKKNGIHWNWGHGGKVTIKVSGAALKAAEIAGSGNILIDRVAGNFSGDVAGSGNLDLAKVEGGKIDLSIAGSGGVRAVGKAEALDISIAGSGDVDTTALDVVAADISIAGSGNVRARATGTADVAIMGSGDVEIVGGAKCDVSKHGSGDVRCS
jgi:hypothetical protein